MSVYVNDDLCAVAGRPSKEYHSPWEAFLEDMRRLGVFEKEMDGPDLYNMSRFRRMHRRHYKEALQAVRNSQSLAYWRAYMFPSHQWLERNPLQKPYRILSMEEAEAFWKDEILGMNLREITEAVLQLSPVDVRYIFGIDGISAFQSSMTIFAMVVKDCSLFKQALVKFFDGQMDKDTLMWLNRSDNQKQECLST